MAALDRTRQRDLVDEKALLKSKVTIIGAGAIGSFTALTIGKMGAGRIVLYDDDGVSDHNLPNQFFRKRDVRQFKVEALQGVLEEFADATTIGVNRKYIDEPLTETTIVATDSMSSRKMIWEQFKKQKQAIHLIEARMGAELGMVYTMTKFRGKGQIPSLNNANIKFYESRLYDGSTVKPLPCTGKTIIYNVLMLASLICRSYKGLIMGQKVPKELIFNMTQLDERSYMFTA